MASPLKLPVAEELKELPCWARVALAASCARRARQLVSPDDPPEFILAVEQAVVSAENAAQTPGNATQASARKMAAIMHEVADYYDRTSKEADRENNPRSAYAARLRSSIAAAAAFAAQSAAETGDAEAAYRALYSSIDAMLAHNAVLVTGRLPRQRVVDSVRKTLASLAEQARTKNWTDQTPIPRQPVPA